MFFQAMMVLKLTKDLTRLDVIFEVSVRRFSVNLSGSDFMNREFVRRV